MKEVAISRATITAIASHTTQSDPAPQPEQEMSPMQQCEVCGNEYEQAFDVVMNGTTHTFDSFECAIDRLAPRCEHCECRIIGHGIEADGAMYCCAHCARKSGVMSVVDHV